MYIVATVLTVYGIETSYVIVTPFTFSEVATVLTVYGIETENVYGEVTGLPVATVLTVYGIETFLLLPQRTKSGR